eukprot:1622389-Pyramimonas_sp.AAC.1
MLRARAAAPQVAALAYDAAATVPTTARGGHCACTACCAAAGQAPAPFARRPIYRRNARCEHSRCRGQWAIAPRALAAARRLMRSPAAATSIAR